VPYTLDANDMRFATPQGFNSGDQFETYLKDSFDTLYAEGRRARMLSIGLHCRLVGRPGRAAALKRALDHMAPMTASGSPPAQIADHWAATHPPATAPPVRDGPRHLRRSLRRHLRAFPLDRRTRLRAGAWPDP
jgi:hypothetical protein